MHLRTSKTFPIAFCLQTLWVQEFCESWNLAWWFFSSSQIYIVGDRINRWKSQVDEYNWWLFTRGILVIRSREVSRKFRLKRRHQIPMISWWFFSSSQIYAFWAIKNRLKSRVGKPYWWLSTRGICMQPNTRPSSRFSVRASKSTSAELCTRLTSIS